MALGLVGSAVAEVVTIQGDPLDANAALTLADQWTAGTNDPDSFGEILSAEVISAEAQAPLLELMGMPAQRSHRGKPEATTRPALFELAAGGQGPARLANPPSLDDADDDALALGRKARDLLEVLSGASGSSEPDGVNRRTAVPGEAPPVDAPSGPREGRSSWLREGLFMLRAHREWVLVGMLTVLGAMFGLRHFGQATGAAKPGARKPARSARLARLAR